MPPRDYDPEALLQKYARAYNVPIELARAIMGRESAGNQYTRGGGLVTSKKGALGLMQLMPGTAAALGVDAADPEQNVMGGVKYISQIMAMYPGRHDLVAAGYNWGPHRPLLKQLFSQNQPLTRGAPQETLDYVQHVMGRLAQVGPPEAPQQGTIAQNTRTRLGIQPDPHLKPGAVADGAAPEPQFAPPSDLTPDEQKLFGAPTAAGPAAAPGANGAYPAPPSALAPPPAAAGDFAPPSDLTPEEQALFGGAAPPAAAAPAGPGFLPMAHPGHTPPALIPAPTPIKPLGNIPVLPGQPRSPGDLGAAKPALQSAKSWIDAKAAEFNQEQAELGRNIKLANGFLNPAQVDAYKASQRALLKKFHDLTKVTDDLNALGKAQRGFAKAAPVGVALSGVDDALKSLQGKNDVGSTKRLSELNQTKDLLQGLAAFARSRNIPGSRISLSGKGIVFTGADGKADPGMAQEWARWTQEQITKRNAEPLWARVAGFIAPFTTENAQALTPGNQAQFKKLQAEALKRFPDTQPQAGDVRGEQGSYPGGRGGEEFAGRTQNQLEREHAREVWVQQQMARTGVRDPTFAGVGAPFGILADRMSWALGNGLGGVLEKFGASALAKTGLAVAGKEISGEILPSAWRAGMLAKLQRLGATIATAGVHSGGAMGTLGATQAIAEGRPEQAPAAFGIGLGAGTLGMGLARGLVGRPLAGAVEQAAGKAAVDPVGTATEQASQDLLGRGLPRAGLAKNIEVLGGLGVSSAESGVGFGLTGAAARAIQGKSPNEIVQHLGEDTLFGALMGPAFVALGMGVNTGREELRRQFGKPDPHATQIIEGMLSNARARGVPEDHLVEIRARMNEILRARTQKAKTKLWQAFGKDVYLYAVGDLEGNPIDVFGKPGAGPTMKPVEGNVVPPEPPPPAAGPADAPSGPPAPLPPGAPGPEPVTEPVTPSVRPPLRFPLPPNLTSTIHEDTWGEALDLSAQMGHVPAAQDLHEGLGISLVQASRLQSALEALGPALFPAPTPTLTPPAAPPSTLPTPPGAAPGPVGAGPSVGPPVAPGMTPDLEAIYHRVATDVINGAPIPTTADIQRQFHLPYDQAGRIIDRMLQEQGLPPDEVPEGLPEEQHPPILESTETGAPLGGITGESGGPITNAPTEAGGTSITQGAGGVTTTVTDRPVDDIIREEHRNGATRAQAWQQFVRERGNQTEITQEQFDALWDQQLRNFGKPPAPATETATEPTPGSSSGGSGGVTSGPAPTHAPEPATTAAPPTADPFGDLGDLGGEGKWLFGPSPTGAGSPPRAGPAPPHSTQPGTATAGSKQHYPVPSAATAEHNWEDAWSPGDFKPGTFARNPNGGATFHLITRHGSGPGAGSWTAQVADPGPNTDMAPGHEFTIPERELHNYQVYRAPAAPTRPAAKPKAKPAAKKKTATKPEEKKAEEPSDSAGNDLLKALEADAEPEAKPVAKEPADEHPEPAPTPAPVDHPTPGEAGGAGSEAAPAAEPPAPEPTPAAEFTPERQPEKLTDVPGVKPGTAALVQTIQTAILTASPQSPIKFPELRRLAEDAFSGTRGNGTWDIKDLYDAMEVALNRAIEILADGLNPDAVPRLTLAENLVSRLPKQRDHDRTEEQIELQQFSTPPPLAFLAALAADIQPGDRVLEPSAGTGNLALWARLAGGKVLANEISDRRRALLEMQGYETSDVDAAHIFNLLPEEERPDVVLMNPPFSARGDRRLSHTNRVGQDHLRQALRLLPPGGRLVAILGEGAAAAKPMFKPFWDEIGSVNEILANVGIPGAAYASNATKFGTQLVVIDKKRPLPGHEPVTGSVKNLQELLDVLETLPRRPAQNEGPAAGAAPEGEPAEPGVGPDHPGVSPVPGGAPEGGAPGPGSGGPGRAVGTERAGPAVAGAGESPGAVPEEQPGPGGNAARPIGRKRPVAGRAADTRADERPRPADAPSSTGYLPTVNLARPLRKGDMLWDNTPGSHPDENQARVVDHRFDVSDGTPEVKLQYWNSAWSDQAPHWGPVTDWMPYQDTGDHRDTQFHERWPLMRPGDAGSVSPEDNRLQGNGDLEEIAFDLRKDIGGGQVSYSVEVDPKVAARNFIARLKDPEWLKRFDAFTVELMRRGREDYEPWDAGMAHLLGPEWAALPEKYHRLTYTSAAANWAKVKPAIPELRLGRNPLYDQREAVTGGQYVYYQPAWVRGGSPHPARMVETAAMAAVDPPQITYKTALPPEIFSEGRLSNVQAEPVFYAGQRFDLTLTNGARAGMFVGDGTGSGKGRISAAIIYDQWLKGERRHVWTSVKKGLINDARRDMLGILLPPDLLRQWELGQITPEDAVRRVGAPLALLPRELPSDSAKDLDEEGDGLYFITYDTLGASRSSPRQKRGETPEEFALRREREIVAKALKPTRLEQLARWMKNSGVLVMDECHTMKNARGSGGGANDGSARGRNSVAFQAMIPNAKVVYLSATGASEVRHLNYATRLGIWGPGTPFPDFGHFQSEIESNGIGAMEVVSRSMKALGMYLARSISFGPDENGVPVEFKRTVAALTPEQRQQFDVATDLMSTALRKLVETRETLNNASSKAGKLAWNTYWGMHQHFFRDLITGFKTDTLIRLVEEKLAEDYSVVITLIGTQATDQQTAVSEALGEGTAIEELDFNPTRKLVRWLENHWPDVVHDETVAPDGSKSYSPRPDPNSPDGLLHDRDAQAERDELIRAAGRIRLPMTPLDRIIRHFGVDNVAELTGREKRILLIDGEERMVNRNYGLGRVRNDTSVLNPYEADLFQSGKKRVAIVSSAADTGITLSSALSAANQQRRYHIPFELAWSAEPEMQRLGRSHRSNQRIPPFYDLLTSEIAGEARFISSVARRLASMGALASGDRTSTGGLDLAAFDVESEYGEAALTATLTDLIHRRVGATVVPPEPGDPNGPSVEQLTGGLEPREVLELMGFVVSSPQNPTPPLTITNAQREDVKGFLNRSLGLPFEMQNTLVNHFFNKFEEVTAAAREQGMFDAGTSDITAKRLTSKEPARVIREDAVTKAPIVYHHLNAVYDVHPLEWTDIARRAADIPRDRGGFYKNQRSGKIAFLEHLAQRQASDGRHYVPLLEFRPLTGRTHGDLTVADLDKWELLGRPEAQKQWEEEVEALPDERNESIHLITGPIISVWDLLAGARTGGRRMELARVKLDDGERLVGQRIPPRAIATVLNELGIQGSYDTPENIFAHLMGSRNGTSVRLTTGLVLRTSSIDGERMIMVDGVDYAQRSELMRLGVIEKRHGHQWRYNVPPDEESGVHVLGKVIERYPAVSETPSTSPALNAAQSFETHRPTPVERAERAMLEAPVQMALHDAGISFSYEPSEFRHFRPGLKLGAPTPDNLAGWHRSSDLKFGGKSAWVNWRNGDWGADDLQELRANPFYAQVAPLVSQLIRQLATKGLGPEMTARITRAGVLFFADPDGLVHGLNQADPYGPQTLGAMRAGVYVNLFSPTLRPRAAAARPSDLAVNLVGTMLHELAHMVTRNEGEDLGDTINELQGKIGNLTLMRAAAKLARAMSAGGEIGAPFSEEFMRARGHYASLYGRDGRSPGIRGGTRPGGAASAGGPDQARGSGGLGRPDQRGGAPDVRRAPGASVAPSWDADPNAAAQDRDLTRQLTDIFGGPQLQRILRARANRAVAAPGGTDFTHFDGHFQDLIGIWPRVPYEVRRQLFLQALRQAQLTEAVNVDAPTPAPSLADPDLETDDPASELPVPAGDAKAYNFRGSQTGQVFEEARGTKPLSRLAQAQALGERFLHLATREWEHLAKGARHAELRLELNRLRDGGRAWASEKAMERIARTLGGMNDDQYDAFNYALILQDMLEEVAVQTSDPELGGGGRRPENVELPNGLTAQQVWEDAGHFDAYLKATGQYEDLYRVVEARRQMMAAVRDAYADAMRRLTGHAPEFNRLSYFRHQVMAYMAHRRPGTNTLDASTSTFVYTLDTTPPPQAARRMRSPESRSFLLHREGSYKAYNTDYIQAEHEVLAQMLYDTEIFNLLSFVKSEYDVAKQVRIAALWVNDENILPFFQELADAHNDALIEEGYGGTKKLKTAEQMYRGVLNAKQAQAFDSFRRYAEEGLLPDGGNPRWQAVIEKLAEDHRVPGPIGSAQLYKGMLDDSAMREIQAYCGWLLQTQGGEAGSGPAALLFKGMAEKRAFIKRQLREKWVTPEDLLRMLEHEPHVQEIFAKLGVRTDEKLTVFHPKEGNVVYRAWSLTDRLAEAVRNQSLEGIVPDQHLKRVTVLSKNRQQWMVPQDVADTLDTFARGIDDPVVRFLAEAQAGVLQAWKGNAILGIHHIVTAGIRNLSGDAEAAFAGNPTGFKHAPRAAAELGAFMFRGVEPPVEEGTQRAPLAEWIDRGGLQSLLMIVEKVGQIGGLQLWDRLRGQLDPAIALTGKTGKALQAGWEGYWGKTRKLMEYREAILRYANYLSYHDQLTKDLEARGPGTPEKAARPQNYGASLRAEIDALSTLDKKAFALSNELLGPYDQVTELGRFLRTYLMPFHSWDEVDTRRWYRMWSNSWHSERQVAFASRRLLGKAAGLAAKSPLIALKWAGFLAMAHAFTAATTGFNLALHPKEEASLPDDIRSRPHLVLGSDPVSGKVYYIGRLGAYHDSLKWYGGMDGGVRYLDDYLNNRRSLGEIGKQMVQSPVNEAWQTLHPGIKLGYGLVAGKETFPDVFKQRPIRDPLEPFFNTVGLQAEYDLAMRRPSRGGSDYLARFFANVIEPESTNYSELIGMRMDFLKRVGMGSGGGEPTEKANAAFWYKQAIRYEDKVAEVKFLAEYVKQGGTKKGLVASLTANNPLNQLGKHEEEFLENLSPMDRERLRRAMLYWARLNEVPETDLKTLIEEHRELHSYLKRIEKLTHRAILKSVHPLNFPPPPKRKPKRPL